MERLSEVGYCGVYCPNCGARCRLPQRAAALITTMKAGEYDDWGHGLEGFTTFWKFLHGLADVSEPKRCRNEICGAPNCGMRKCAKDKGIEACPLCADYPCEMIQTFSRSEPTLIFDGQRMGEIGLEQWIDEQEARKLNGFCYDDMRCGKANITQGK